MSVSCERVNTYEVLEHIMGIKGLHPHGLDTIRDMRLKLAKHINHNVALAEGVVVDIGCGSGAGTYELSSMLTNNQQIIGIDISCHAIESARKLHGNLPNLSFYQGDIQGFLNSHPNVKISGAICISASMFIQDLAAFYRHIYYALVDGGMFIDAPFMFKTLEETTTPEFHLRTSAVCGCNMKMFQLQQLKNIFHEARFTNVDCIEHEFDLMKLRVLFNDYPAHYLIGNFFRNVIVPPAHFGKVTSRYIFTRTVKIFMFFLQNRHKYAGGEFCAVKAAH